MTNISKCITDDKGIVMSCINSTDIVKKMKELHNLDVSVTAALGRLITVTALMGYGLKNPNDMITVKINDGIKLNSLISTADSSGNVKGYATVNKVKLVELDEFGQPNVNKIIGNQGNLTVIKDVGLPEPNIGTVKLATGGIAEDIAVYYALSEQIPTAVGAGVFLDGEEVKAAGGYIVHRLPEVSEETVSIIERNIKNNFQICGMFLQGMTELDICAKILETLNYTTIDKSSVEYKCECNRERVTDALLSLSADDREQIYNDKGNVIANCQFCNKSLTITRDELNKLL